MASLVPEFAPEDALAACLKLQTAGETLPADSTVPFGDKGERIPVVTFVRGHGLAPCCPLPHPSCWCMRGWHCGVLGCEVLGCEVLGCEVLGCRLGWVWLAFVCGAVHCGAFAVQ
jgi:hypothetical protein